MEAPPILIFNQAVIFVAVLGLIFVVLRIGHRLVAAIEALARAKGVSK